ncbi:MAG: glycosyltransferase family 2 protein [Lachnospiraceae bacterium]|nr:glycosyltransferase family 2 protein [Lachnospiraceae bacterium]
MAEISIIIPCYNEEEAIPVYYARMQEIIQSMGVDMELIFVDDGSRDGTLVQLQQMAREDSAVRYLSFSRNFGKEAGIYAGLRHAKGAYVAVMDVDLQDPPEMLPEMYGILQTEAYDCVATRRSTRTGEPKVRSWLSDRFYQMMHKLSNTDIVNGARDYRLMTRKMADAVLEMSEYNRFSKGIFQWVGFRTKWLEFANTKRCAGETKWSFRKLLAYSVEGITGYTVAPLSLASVVGLLFCVVSFLMIGFIVVRTLLFGDPVAGWPSLICVIFLVSGIQLFCLGIVGAYLSRTYLETKKRPIYILKESGNFPDGEGESHAVA